MTNIFTQIVDKLGSRQKALLDEMRKGKTKQPATYEEAVGTLIEELLGKDGNEINVEKR